MTDFEVTGRRGGRLSYWPCVWPTLLWQCPAEVPRQLLSGGSSLHVILPTLQLLPGASAGRRRSASRTSSAGDTQFRGQNGTCGLLEKHGHRLGPERPELMVQSQGQNGDVRNWTHKATLSEPERSELEKHGRAVRTRTYRAAGLTAIVKISGVSRMPMLTVGRRQRKGRNGMKRKPRGMRRWSNSI